MIHFKSRAYNYFSRGGGRGNTKIRTEVNQTKEGLEGGGRAAEDPTQLRQADPVNQQQDETDTTRWDLSINS